MDGIPAIGSVVAGKFRIDRLLGLGGMGAVFAARHLALGETMAIKFLLADLAADKDSVLRFLREARAATRIKSENVVRVTDAGTADGVPYMVMEYLEGRDLGDLLDE